MSRPALERGSARSEWTRVRLTRSSITAALQRQTSLRLHGAIIGFTTLSATWLATHGLMLAGVGSLALRYAVALGIGYAVYLLVLGIWGRAMARRLHGRRHDGSASDAVEPVLDIVDWIHRSRSAPGKDSGLVSGQGGDFGGGGATGDFGASAGSADATAADGGALEWAGDALGAAASAEEGAVVLVPVVVMFLAALAVALGAGALVLVVFGSEALLAVAVELAFSYASARTAVRLERDGWLVAAVRLTWRPLLTTLACAVALGALLDWAMPDARSLPEAVQLWRATAQ